MLEAVVAAQRKGDLARTVYLATNEPHAPEVHHLQGELRVRGVRSFVFQQLVNAEEDAAINRLGGPQATSAIEQFLCAMANTFFPSWPSSWDEEVIELRMWWQATNSTFQWELMRSRARWYAHRGPRRQEDECCPEEHAPGRCMVPFGAERPIVQLKCGDVDINYTMGKNRCFVIVAEFGACRFLDQRKVLLEKVCAARSATNCIEHHWTMEQELAPSDDIGASNKGSFQSIRHHPRSTLNQFIASLVGPTDYVIVELALGGRQNDIMVCLLEVAELVDVVLVTDRGNQPGHQGGFVHPFEDVWFAMGSLRGAGVAVYLNSC